jgi:hypothetical protein
MSKPVVRVVVAVLICLAVVASISPSVQAKLESVFQKTEANTAASSSAVTEGQTLQEGTLNQSAPASPQFDKSRPSDSSHDCNSDPSADY